MVRSVFIIYNSYTRIMQREQRGSGAGAYVAFIVGEYNSVHVHVSHKLWIGAI